MGRDGNLRLKNYEKLDLAQHGERWGFQLQR
jgi:hypothetical protein